MLQSASKGRLSVHHANIMTFYIPNAFPKAEVVSWDSDGINYFNNIHVLVILNKYCVNDYVCILLLLDITLFLCEMSTIMRNACMYIFVCHFTAD